SALGVPAGLSDLGRRPRRADLVRCRIDHPGWRAAGAWRTTGVSGLARRDDADRSARFDDARAIARGLAPRLIAPTVVRWLPAQRHGEHAPPAPTRAARQWP